MWNELLQLGAQVSGWVSPPSAAAILACASIAFGYAIKDKIMRKEWWKEWVDRYITGTGIIGLVGIFALMFIFYLDVLGGMQSQVLVSSSSQIEPINESKLIVVLDKHFYNQRVILDGHEYVHCSFVNVMFVYNGKPFKMNYGTISGAMLTSDLPELDRYTKIMFELGFLKVPLFGPSGQMAPSTTYPIQPQIKP